MNQKEFRTLVEMLQPIIYGDVETRSMLQDEGIELLVTPFQEVDTETVAASLNIGEIVFIGSTH